MNQPVITVIYFCNECGQAPETRTCPYCGTKAEEAGWIMGVPNTDA